MSEQTTSLAELFTALGYDYKTLEEDTIIDISHRNVEIKSFDHENDKVVFKKVLFLLRKYDAECWELQQWNPENCSYNIILRGTPAHKVYDPIKKEYISITQAEYVLLENGSIIKVTAWNTHEKIPILDLEVEETGCYFSNGILSHNTTGGNALKFYTSQRIDIRRVGAVKDGENIIGNQTRIKVVKNKIAPPYREHEFVITYGNGIDKFTDCLRLAVDANIVEKSGAWYSYQGERIGQGEANSAHFLKEHPDMFNQLLSRLKGNTPAVTTQETNE